MQIDDHFQAIGGRFSNIGFTGWSTPPTTTPLAIGVWGLGTTTGVFGLIDDRSVLPTTAIPTADSYAGTAGVLGAGNTDTGVAGISNRVGVFGQSGPAPALSAGRTCGVLGASLLAPGVIGQSDHNSGVIGMSNQAAGVFGSSTGFAGVSGFSQNHTGVDGRSTTTFGVLGSSSPNVPLISNFTAAGVIGTSDQFPGVVGVSTQVGVFGFCNTAGGTGVFGEATPGTGSFAGFFNGNVRVVGAVIADVKDAVVPFPDGTQRVLHCMESPEHWFEDFGMAKLKGGRALVQLDADFIKSINTKGYHVFVTPTGDCQGLYVSDKTAKSFEVRELGGGKSNVAFSYRIVGRRKDITGHKRFAKVADEPPAVPGWSPPRTPPSWGAHKWPGGGPRLAGQRSIVGLPPSLSALVAKVSRPAKKKTRGGRRKPRRSSQLSKLLTKMRKQARAKTARTR